MNDNIVLIYAIEMKREICNIIDIFELMLFQMNQIEPASNGTDYNEVEREDTYVSVRSRNHGEHPIQHNSK